MCRRGRVRGGEWGFQKGGGCPPCHASRHGFPPTAAILCVFLSVCMCVCVYVCRSVAASLLVPFVQMSAFLHFCLYVCLFVCLAVSSSLFLSVFSSCLSVYEYPHVCRIASYLRPPLSLQLSALAVHVSVFKYLFMYASRTSACRVIELYVHLRVSVFASACTLAVHRC